MTPTKLLIGQIILVFAVVIASIWGATQWTADALGHQPRLGAPWFMAGGTPVYKPWRLFQWWYAFEPYAPAIFNRAGIMAASGGVLGAVAAIVCSLWRARLQKFVTTYGSARWAVKKDVAAAGLFKPAGVFLGKWQDRYLRHDGPEHVMAFAPTRSGKGVGLVVPTLLSWTDSAIIHDIKGENWELTAGWRSTFSHCLLFDPTNPNSSRYNPLLEVRRGDNEVRDVQNIADILIDPEGSLERRNHWELSGHALLVGVILHVLYAEEDKTLAGCAAFMSDPRRSFEATLAAMMKTNHVGTEVKPRAHPVVAQVARELLNKSENERSGVLSTAMSFMSLYRDPVIARVTGASDWRIADLTDRAAPASLYLVTPPSDIARTRPLMRLILNQIGRRLTETPPARNGWGRVFLWLGAVAAFAGRLLGQAADRPAAMAPRKHKGRRRVLMMLDEFPALGRLDFFESTLAFMAGYGVRAYMIAQSLNQIEKAYGPNNAILDNCHVRIAFATNDERTAKRVSDAIGTTTEQRAQRNYAGHRLAPWLSHVMVSAQETQRALITPGEVMQLPPNEAIVMVSGARPIRARKLRYYEDRNFTERLFDAPAAPARPDGRANDWTGRKNPPELSPGEPVAGGDPDGGGDEGGRPLHRAPELNGEARRLCADDEVEKNLDASDSDAQVTEDPEGERARRAAAMDRDDDDLLPDF